MAFSLQVSATAYAGNGSTSTPYPVVFPVVSASHIAVTVRNPAASAPVLLGAHQFSVTALGGGNYEVRTATAWPDTALVTVYRSVPFDQPFEFPEGGKFKSKEVERALDRIVMQMHQLWRLYTGGDGGTILPGTGDTVQSIMVWATGADRGTTKPDYVGQLGVQLSDSTIWLATSTDAGDWVNADTSRRGGVLLRVGGNTSRYFEASEDTAGSRRAALKDAIEAAYVGYEAKAYIELLQGDFVVEVGAPLSDDILPGTGPVVVIPSPAAPLIYLDPEDASADCDMFRGPRDIRAFGAVSTPTGGTPVDCGPAVQAAYNSLPLFPDTTEWELASGRSLRSGKVVAPDGNYWMGRQIHYSPTTQFEGETTRGTVFNLMPEVFNDPGDTTEKILFEIDLPLVIDINNLFYTSFSNVLISAGNSEDNIRASGLKIAGGQGTALTNVTVIGFYLRNCIANGGQMMNCWFPNARRGPGLDWSNGGSADYLSVEHVNGVNGPEPIAGAIDPGTGRRYPAVRLNSGFFDIGVLAGEEDGGTPQTFCEIINVLGCTIGQSFMGVANGSARTHLLFHILGTSQNVDIRQMTGLADGLFPWDMGTLINDVSDYSPNGAGVAYVNAQARGSYSQRTGSPAGRDIVEMFTKSVTFSEGLVAGTTAGIGFGLEVKSSEGSIYLFGGSYETTRATSFFNYNTPRPTNWNAGVMTLTTSGVLNVTGEYRVDDIKVLGNQQAAIADATDAASAITQLNLLLAAARTHGMIAT